MQRRIAVTLAVLICSAMCMTACKKENAQTTETPTGTGQTGTGATPTTGTVPTDATGSAPQAAPGAAAARGKTGEQLFTQYCAVCHPNGGNTVNPEKPLGAKDMAQHNISKSEDIVRLMRNPGPGMNKFDEATIPDKEARMIGEYILTTFK